MTAARRLVKRAFRDRDGRFLAEGPQACREAAAAPGVLLELYVTAEAAGRHPDIVAAARAAAAPRCVRASGEVVASLSGTVHPAGDGRRLRPRRRHRSTTSSPPRPRSSRSWRTPATPATSAPSSAARTPPASAASCSPRPASTRSTPRRCGPPPARCSTCPWSPARAWRTSLPALRAAGLRVLAADGAGERDLDDLLDDGSLARPTAWVFGNEAWGLPEADPRAVRRRRAGADPRPGREPQPRRRRRRLPLRLGPRPAPSLSPRLAAECSLALARRCDETTYALSAFRPLGQWNTGSTTTPRGRRPAVPASGRKGSRHGASPPPPDPRGDRLRRARQLPAADRPGRVEEPGVRRLEVLGRHPVRAARIGLRRRSSATASGTSTRPRPTRTGCGSTRRPRSPRP